MRLRNSSIIGFGSGGKQEQKPTGWRDFTRLMETWKRDAISKHPLAAFAKTKKYENMLLGFDGNTN